MMTEPEIREALRAWVLKVNKTLPAESLTNQTPLIENRLITSLQMLELILLIEKLRGRRFDLKSLKPGVFSNLDTIYQQFFLEPEKAS